MTVALLQRPDKPCAWSWWKGSASADAPADHALAGTTSRKSLWQVVEGYSGSRVARRGRDPLRRW